MEMKYRVLLTGENHSAIDDFFLLMQDTFKSLTASERRDDIINHLKIFKPDVFVYCINGESQKNFNTIYSLKEELKKRGIPLVVIGDEEDCYEFERIAIKTADLILRKPLMASSIEEKIYIFLEHRRKAKEECIRQEEERIRQEEEQKRLEQERIKQEEERRKHEKTKEKKHVLIIDDDPVMLKLVNGQLREKYDVATAISGNLALKFLEKKHTDLILLDYEMPGDDGPTVLRKLRNNPETKDIPVLFLTAITQRSKIEDVIALKPQGYLLKPIESEKLHQIIAEVLNSTK